jgi:hypothetical protein
MSRDQDARGNQSVKPDNSSFERVEEFKYLGTNITNQYSIKEEIKSRVKSGNVCYHSVQNLLSSIFLSTSLKIEIYRNIIFPVDACRCETWSLILREKHRLRVFENMVLRRIFGPKRDKARRDWRKLHNEGLDDLYSSPNIVRVIKSRKVRWAGHVARMGEQRHIQGFGGGNLRERDHLENSRLDGRVILRWIFRKWDVGAWTGSSWHRIGTGGGLL